MINRFGNVVSEIMLELASSDSFTAYLDNTAAEREADDSSADANAGTRSINSRSTKLYESHVIADGAAGMQEVDAPTTPSEQHVMSTSGETVTDANECTVTRATSEAELLRAASKSMFDRGNLLPPPKAKQSTAENKPTDSAAEVAFKKAPQTAADESTETAARPTVKSPLKVPIPLRKGVAESEREAKAAPDTDKATTPEWTPESRINILTRAANRVRMISRVTQKRDEQFDLPTDAYGYVMNRSMSSASDQSLFRSPGHSGSINSTKDGFANRKGDAASAGYRCYGISRRAGIKLGTISSRYNRVNDALKALEVEDIGAVREAHFLQHTKTVSALWSRHGNVAVSR
ncbi:hypothetical protein, conserved [Babesia bigemina]|uniref:Uncharacterized protein n=1 Tax=Babesia bigemina TaxID=5866 RepID=A0A061D9K5_BABBI|nr:hypothetical protein, conserved [Babesia bigemina]CDR96667.1 hypothetical protein, conserved [Babesia bigemina]|eukprot:XP_012768853.1 hypothetical protein, conserved [Babesia bigemina]